MRIPVLRAALLVAVAGATFPLAAQVPGLENFSLERPQPPTPSPTPTATVPSPTTSPAPTSIPTPRAVPSPTPTATPAPAPSASTTAAPTASPSTSPTAGPTATPSPTSATPVAAEPSPLPIPLPSASASMRAETPAGPGGWLPWVVGVLALLLALSAGWWWRARRSHAAARAPAPADERVAPEPAPAPEQVAPAPPAPAAPVPAAAPGGLVTTALRPALDFALVPHAAGIDSLRATLDYVLTLRNTGRATAQAVAVEAWLFSVGTDPAGVLEELAGLPAGVPMIAPFAMPASAAFDLPGQAAVDRAALAVLTAGERKLFVPVLGVRALYRDGAGAPQVAVAAFMIGIARAGQERLAPLPLDRGARGFTGLAARRYEG